MKLIVGLGNPGPEYMWTPHNAGYLAIDRLAEGRGAVLANRRCRALTGKAVVAGQECLLAKPETFMNLSGVAVASLAGEYGREPARDLSVLYDELAFPLGTLRVAASGSSNGHNGVKSIAGALGTEAWPRVRIGVGRGPAPDGRQIRAGGSDYLFQPLRKADLALLDEALDRAVQAVEVMVAEGVGAAMNRFNRREE